jgi:hypothetical protein
VGERTAHAWLRNPAFHALIGEFRRRLLDQAVGRLTDAANEAADTLRELLKADFPPAVRIGAARAVIDAMVRAREHAEVAERAETMERRAGEDIPPGLVVPDRDERFEPGKEGDS